MIYRVLLAVCLCLATPALACTDSLPRSASRTIDPNRLDQAAIAASILVYTNQARCSAGLPALQSLGPLNAISASHSTWMAAAQKMTHTSTQPGMRKLKDRFNSVNLEANRGAENVAFLPFLQIGIGEQVTFEDEARCKFRRTTGERVAAHTYGSFAQAVVTAWMNSRSHRRNILKNNLTHHGAGFAYDPKATLCGHLYVTQAFAG